MKQRGLLVVMMLCLYSQQNFCMQRFDCIAQGAQQFLKIARYTGVNKYLHQLYQNGIDTACELSYVMVGSTAACYYIPRRLPYRLCYKPSLLTSTIFGSSISAMYGIYRLYHVLNSRLCSMQQGIDRIDRTTTGTAREVTAIKDQVQIINETTSKTKEDTAAIRGTVNVLEVRSDVQSERIGQVLDNQNIIVGTLADGFNNVRAHQNQSDDKSSAQHNKLVQHVKDISLQLHQGGIVLTQVQQVTESNGAKLSNIESHQEQQQQNLAIIQGKLVKVDTNVVDLQQTIQDGGRALWGEMSRYHSSGHNERRGLCAEVDDKSSHATMELLLKRMDNVVASNQAMQATCMQQAQELQRVKSQKASLQLLFVAALMARKMRQSYDAHCATRQYAPPSSAELNKSGVVGNFWNIILHNSDV